MDDDAFGWPAAHLSKLPSGDYLVQAVLNRYEAFHLADGRNLMLPPDKGEGQQWASKPGNLYSKPMRLHIDAANPVRTAVVLDQEITALAPKPDTEFVRHKRIRSELLSRFWGRDVFIGAYVLLPGRVSTYGGSTGGWEALATQVFYPDMYNGAFAACPDPIDFRAFTLINLYQDKNAYALRGEAARVERPAFRNNLGEIFATQRDANYMELAQGDHSRSGGQYDIWQAVFGPSGTDSYPRPIFDKLTGDIDSTVAAYWRDHFDLSYIIARDWRKLEPKLKGKIHIHVGNGDNYYLTDAVYFNAGAP